MSKAMQVHAGATIRDFERPTFIAASCSYCGDDARLCAENLVRFLTRMSTRELLQWEWGGGHARHYLRDLRKASAPPAALVEKQERLLAAGMAADHELTRRGVGERYC